MCGIAGFIDPSVNKDIAVSRGNAMMQSLLHRGPDAGDLWIDDNHGMVLAHRRLAIQDLTESGHQPMHSASGRYCVVYNGEIYNFLEISTVLSQRGYRFNGHSDTEVLLASVEEWGIEGAIRRFSGMFAFALWDKHESVLHLCRDRLGEKPLYYGWTGKCFCFASELKAIEACADESFDIDIDGLEDFLRNGYISAPATIYRDVYKLSPGSILSMPLPVLSRRAAFSPVPSESVTSPRIYWSVSDSAVRGLSDPVSDENQAVDLLDQVLHTSIKRQLIADVNVGCFLSGGIDSSLVSAIAQDVSQAPLKTYTIGFTEKEYDESGHAEKIAAHLGTEHLTMHVEPRDVLDVVPLLPQIFDEPFADSSQIPAYLVSKLAKKHVTVCLSGDGGDELFAGYNRYLWADNIWRRVSKMPAVLRRAVGHSLAAPSPSLWDLLYSGIAPLIHGKAGGSRLVGLKMQKLAGFIQQNDIQQGYEYLMSFWTEPERLLKRDIVMGRAASQPTLPANTGFLDNAMFSDQVKYLPGDNLAKVDRASMAVSLESRLPLLDHEVVELSWRIPVEMKLKGGQTKWPLRQLIYKYIPSELIDRPKMGFSVPVDRWLRGELSEWAADLLFRTCDLSRGLLQSDPVIEAWREHKTGKRDHSHRIWTVLMFLAWMDR